MRQLFLVGRIVVGAYYLYSGFHHFTNLGQMSSYAAAKHVPEPTLAVAVAGALLIVAGLSFLLGVLPRVGVAATALFFIPVTLFMHAFWTEHDPSARMMDMINFTKNLALLGSSLMFVAIPEPWPYSVHGRVARREVHAPA